ncbi:hypothetical protein [Oryza sativa Japonica Group]|uniref:Uncharacterized protein n=1 Tax=Oryza sativa subsp. japonica TaxID=39947 RepID=Q5JMG4_ORYSJ|nr:hypothetical protein [Oryza sativa Japonica Group]
MATLPVAAGAARRVPNVGWRTPKRGKVMVAAFWLRPRRTSDAWSTTPVLHPTMPTLRIRRRPSSPGCRGRRRRGGGEAEEARIGMRWRRRGVGGEAASSRRPVTPAALVAPPFRRASAALSFPPPRHSATPPSSRRPASPAAPPSSYRPPAAPTLPLLHRAPTAPLLRQAPAAPPLHRAPAVLLPPS